MLHLAANSDAQLKEASGVLGIRGAEATPSTRLQLGWLSRGLKRTQLCTLRWSPFQHQLSGRIKTNRSGCAPLIVV
jgi:hypothetical protein